MLPVRQLRAIQVTRRMPTRPLDPTSLNPKEIHRVLRRLAQHHAPPHLERRRFTAHRTAHLAVAGQRHRAVLAPPPPPPPKTPPAKSPSPSRPPARYRSAPRTALLPSKPPARSASPTGTRSSSAPPERN